MSRHLDKLVGVWAGLLGLAYIPYLPSNAVVGRWVVLEVGAALLFCLVKVRWTWGHTLGAALLVYMLVGSIFWAVSGLDAVGGLVQWFFGFGLAFCLGYEIRDTRPLWWGLLIGISTSLPFTITQYLGYSSVWVFGGSFGTYLSQNMAAEAGVIGIAAAVALRQLWLVPIPFAVAYLAGARATYLALFAMLVVWVWTSHPKLRIWLGAAFVATVLLVFALYLTGLKPGYFRVVDRIEIWTLITRNVHFWGDGLYSLAVAAPGIEFAHNEVLHYAFELGIGSVFLWALICRALQGRDEGALLALVGILMFAAVWFPFHEPLAGFVVAICAGRLCYCRDLVRSVQPTRRILSVTRPEHDHGTPLGIGASHTDDLRRRCLSVGPQHPLAGADVPC